MNVAEWLRQQFSEDRCRRWLDGARGSSRFGRRSFTRAYEYDTEIESGRFCRVLRPHVWSVVNGGVSGGKRWTYRLLVTFHAAPDSPTGVLAKLHMWTKGIYACIPRGDIHTELLFDSGENAPKKLNREIRRLRECILQPRGKSESESSSN